MFSFAGSCKDYENVYTRTSSYRHLSITDNEYLIPKLQNSYFFRQFIYLYNKDTSILFIYTYMENREDDELRLAFLVFSGTQDLKKSKYQIMRPINMLERFSIESRKTKTKLIYYSIRLLNQSLNLSNPKVKTQVSNFLISFDAEILSPNLLFVISCNFLFFLSLVQRLVVTCSNTLI